MGVCQIHKSKAPMVVCKIKVKAPIGVCEIYVRDTKGQE